MLDMGFREDLERLLDAAPEERRTLMFSATIPKADRRARQALPARRDADRDVRRGRSPPRHRVPGDPDRAARARPRGRQPAALPRRRRRAGVLRDARRRHPPRREPHRARLLGRGAVGRAVAARAQPGAAGAARRPRAGLRRDRRRRARPRPAGPRPRDPRRPAAEQGDAGPPQRPHRPRRQEGPRDPASRVDAARRFVERHAVRRRASRRAGGCRRRRTTSAAAIRISLVGEIQAPRPRSSPTTIARSRATLLAEPQRRGSGRGAGPPAPRGAPGARGAHHPDVDAPARSEAGAADDRRADAPSPRSRGAPRAAEPRRSAATSARSIDEPPRSAPTARPRGPRESDGDVGVVHDQRRPLQERRSEVADPAAVPARRHHEGRDRQDPDPRARDARRDRWHVSERFAAAVRQPDAKDRNIHIEPLDAFAE